MKSQVLHTARCNITGEAAGEHWHWSLLGMKGLIINTALCWIAACCSLRARHRPVPIVTQQRHKLSRKTPDYPRCPPENDPVKTTITREWPDHLRRPSESNRITSDSHGKITRTLPINARNDPTTSERHPTLSDGRSWFRAQPEPMY